MSRRWPAAVLAVTLGVLPACSSSSKATDPGSADPPASLVAVAGTDQQGVALSPDTVHRLGLTTVPISTQPLVPGQPPQPLIPVAAVLYDKDGAIWTYANPKPLLYVRTRIELGEVHGDLAVLRSGPSPGTQVVTVGAAELLGTEYGVAGEQ